MDNTWAASATGISFCLLLSGCAPLPLQKPAPPATRALPCSPAPLGTATLYLRGGMNSWSALDDDAFAYHCDGYYLNVSLNGLQSFKIADATWTPELSFGAIGPQALSDATLTPASRGTDPTGTAEFKFSFLGEQTIKLMFVGGRAKISIGPKTFIDQNKKPVDDKVALSLSYNSRLVTDKAPFGAAPAQSLIAFSLNALPGVSQASLVIEKRKLEGNQDVIEYTEVARLPMTRQAGTDADQWKASYRFNDINVYGYYFEVVIAGQTYLYQNNRDAIYWTRERGSNGLGLVEFASAKKASIRRFRQTIYSQNYTVPTWAKDVVYYYIFPERFRNGDHSNDPKAGIDTYQHHAIEVHANWLEKPYVPHSGDGSDTVASNDFFGGDLQGVIDKLDYIADLGANTIYMTPVFSAPSNHKYDTSDYKHIDPHFGTDVDFSRLTEEAAKRGIRVIPDTSLNHTGSDSTYFDRYGKYQTHGAFFGEKINPASPYANWYTFDASQADPDKQYTGWTGTPDLPELNKNAPGYRAYAYGAPDSVMNIWLDRGAAGWRMDVAPWVPDDFWREWRTAIKTHKPDALTVAETWFDASKFLLGDMFDSTMNYIFRNTLLDYASGAKAGNVYFNIELMREAYPPQAFYALMNLLSTHDQARSLHIFGDLGDPHNIAAIDLAKQRLRLAVFFQMTFPGSPTVYYGDEVGVTGGDDPGNRATYPWADLGGKPDLALLADFRQLIKLRNTHPVLRHGSIDAPLLLNDHVIVLARQDGATCAITATNNSAQTHTVSVKLPAGMHASSFTDALSGATTNVSNGQISLTVPAMFGVVLLGT